ncbi:hypothetical protein JHK87_024326 [Glycine soja]|nr:hypothetical protein JHK87_024326 [Glycine soja]
MERSHNIVACLGHACKLCLVTSYLGTDGQDAFEGPVEEVVRAEAKEAKDSLEKLDIPAWEGRAYDYCMENLKNMGFPVDGLAFHPDPKVSPCPQGDVSIPLRLQLRDLQAVGKALIAAHVQGQLKSKIMSNPE